MSLKKEFTENTNQKNKKPVDVRNDYIIFDSPSLSNFFKYR